MQSEGFSRSDVDLLKTSPSEPVKIDIIKKLHNSLRTHSLSGSEKVVAEEIIRFLAADLSVRVRESIAVKFCDSAFLPYDIAVKLANDLEDVVAVPVIENSNILADKDLVSIIDKGNITRQEAIAKRARISDDLCEHFIQKAAPKTLTTLINNKNVKLSTRNCDSIIRKNADNQPMMKAMIASRKITVSQAHDLLTMVSADLRKILIVEYNIPGNVVNNLIHESKEMLVLNMIAANMETRNQMTLEQMVSRLYAENELSFSVLVKALSFGNLTFFETGMAKLAGITIDELKAKVWSNDQNDFKAIYGQCRLPASMIDAVYKLIHITHEENQNDSPDAAKIYYRILNRLARTSNNEKVLNLDYLVTIVAYNLKKSNLL